MSHGSRIDWENLSRRLEQDRQALEHAADAAPERVAELLRRRARSLASRGTEAARGEELAVLTFSAGGERFALPLAELAGVSGATEYTPVPGAPPELRGACNLRGAIWAAADLPRLLGIPPGAGRGGLVLLRHDVWRVGLCVDVLEGVRHLASGELSPPGAASGMIRGVTADGLQLLETKALLAHPAISAGGGHGKGMQ